MRYLIFFLLYTLIAGSIVGRVLKFHRGLSALAGMVGALIVGGLYFGVLHKPSIHIIALLTGTDSTDPVLFVLSIIWVNMILWSSPLVGGAAIIIAMKKASTLLRT